ncbi:MAG: hypothetical protein IJS93_00715 [Clostridia bacterium]|nr:hypothetical protein [Clostridia bacterium]
MQYEYNNEVELELDCFISEMLIKIGCKIKHNGFYFTKDAIKLIFKYGCRYGELNSIYAIIAKKYGKTFYSVQGGIRRFVERFCASADPKIVYNAISLPIYYRDAGLPASEFLTIMAEQVKKAFVYYNDTLYKR